MFWIICEKSFVDWQCPTNSLHRFFKVTVEMPQGGEIVPHKILFFMLLLPPINLF